VAVSEYVRRLCARVGHDLLLLPSVSLLVLDGPRLLLVRHAGLGDDLPLDRFTRALLTATGQLDRSVPRTARSRRDVDDSAADAVRS
jgi:hypothetical protein